MQRSVLKLNRYSTSSHRHGTSLIEVLVVLVILAVGILSIVRLFPAGFIALRNAENSTFADRLAQSALEALKKNNGALPDAIYMYSDANGYDPNVNPDPNTSDINSQRYISNETITVPASRVVGGTAYPPLYVVNYGPIYLPADVAAVTPPAISIHYLPVNSTPWTARTGSAGFNPGDASYSTSIDNPNDVLQAGQPNYLVDAAAGRIAVPPAAYVQTFQMIVQGNTPSSPVTLTLQVPAAGTAAGAYNGGWFDPTTTFLIADPSTGTVPGTLPTARWTSVTLYRPFEFMGMIGLSGVKAFDSDPYEFQVYSSNIGTNANMGILAFNPLASGQNGAQALKARISYMALDWHILHEDHDVSAGTSTIRLTLNHLKKVGDTQFDQSLFSGLIPGATTSADLILLDLDTGQSVSLNGQAGTSAIGTQSGPGVIDVDNASTTDSTAYQVSYQNGRLTFPSSSTAQHVRIFYAGDADWAVAVQKAPSVYVHSANDDVAPLSENSGQKAAGVTPTPNLYATDAAKEVVYFPPCDAGKTVEFDGVSYTTGGVAKTVAVGTAPISTDLAANGLPYVNLSNSGLNASGVITDTVDTNQPITFTAVRGVSARAVVIWHERNRWRVRTTDTLLTQTQ